jgi:hypothetical protein
MTKVAERNCRKLAFKQGRRAAQARQRYAKLNFTGGRRRCCGLINGARSPHVSRVSYVQPKSLASSHTAGNALVLTEWSWCAKDIRKAAEARAQAKLYAAGVLGGLELKRTRYIVLVMVVAAGAPSDVIESGVTYRHVLVAINPKDPSKAARAEPMTVEIA